MKAQEKVHLRDVWKTRIFWYVTFKDFIIAAIYEVTINYTSDNLLIIFFTYVRYNPARQESSTLTNEKTKGQEE